MALKKTKVPAAEAMQGCLVLSEHEQALLDSYRPMVDAFAALMGEHCEVALHNLADYQHSVVHIANSHNSGRKVGSPISPLALELLDTLEKEKRVSAGPYLMRENGKLLKAVMVIIRGDGGRPIGLLGANVNLNAPFSQIIAAYSPSEEDIAQSKHEQFASSVEELVQRTLEKCIAEIDAMPDVSKTTRNRHLVARLHSEGIFNLRDSVQLVAEALKISKHTVYLYLRQGASDSG